MRTIPRALITAPAVVLWLSAGAAGAAASPPGVLDLAGAWSYRLDGGGGDDGWKRATLPAPASSLATAAGETLRLEREVVLGEGWERRLAPSGLALLIRDSVPGHYRLEAGGVPVGSWRRPVAGIFAGTPRVYDLPAGAVDAGGRVRLALSIHRDGFASGRVRHLEGRIGEGWKLGDRERLRAEAELRRLELLDTDLPLAIMALLFAAIGVYHLQLFRHDRRCREYLWFGLTSLAVTGHTLLHTSWIAQVSGLSGVAGRLVDVTGALIVVASIQFLWPFLSRPIHRLLRAYQLSFLLLAAGIAAVPGTWVPVAVALSKAWAAPFLVAVAVLVATELTRGNAEARTIAVGAFAIVAAGGVELASQILGRGTTFPLQAGAFMIFALSMAFSLSNRFSRVHHELDALRVQLEEMVEDRAAELSAANERLKSEIAEREVAQEAMRMLERAVEQSLDGILVAGLDEDTLFINEAWASMHEYETFEVFGRRLDLFHTAEQMEREVRPALEEVRREGAWEGEVSHLRKDGSIFPTWMSLALLRDPIGEPVGFVAVARDITQRRKALEEKHRIETRIQEAEKLRSLADLAGGIAHDYNNLLTGVLVNSSLARRELPPNSPASDKLLQIGAAAERAADLTTQLLTYAGAESLFTATGDLNELVAAWRSELSAAAAGSRLEIELAEDPVWVDVDGVQVRQAVVNLVANAADAVKASDGGVITLETGRLEADRAYLAGTYPDEDHPPGDYVFLRVSDTGGGIDVEHRHRIFDPFFSTKRSARGLGLATVLSAVRAHHGTIKVTSGPGEGATFELLFPAAGPVGAEAAAEAEIPGWKGSGTVLVIDDEHIMREVSQSILEELGFEVLTTGEGSRALELYRRHRDAIRLVLLDRTMPTMSGEQVLEEILAIDPGARIVMMSGYKKDATVRDLTASGLADFLPKPFRPEELRDKVRGVLEG